MHVIVAAEPSYLDIVCILLFIAIATPAQAALADETGAWQPHHLTLYYLGSTATYSCEGLKIDLEEMLKLSGAQQIAVITPGPCGAGRELVFAQLKFSTLTPTLSGRGNRGQQIVAGSWYHVTISPQNSLLREGSSCELVQQFKNKILPLFVTQNVKANLDCLPFQLTGYPFSLSFDVFALSNAKMTYNPQVP